MRSGGCIRLLCLQSFFFFFFLSLSFIWHDDIRVFWTLGEFRAWEASTWNVLYEHNGSGGAYIFTTATRSRAQRQRIRTNTTEKPWLGIIRQRLSLADDQTDEVEWLARFLNTLAMLKKPYLATHTNKIWDLEFHTFLGTALEPPPSVSSLNTHARTENIETFVSSVDRRVLVYKQTKWSYTDKHTHPVA
ncbi:hypothetical protein GE21DRAFT_210 [Neurospora crassa]|uniref:Uncharacterized protein n=1 Tax=Neurospora crassa (strain ATCC 24698 / 74-OR23-1A / CBS 708.71 / DSM 1257 / FGSC 987) TaxID=367110 RepID=V5INY5_NEUCR|nr:hypothetical protein NCU16318 [Neurospora crassa OR74A]ESA43782.1 hypothetical protein NCU16318 [Neurospora crassa OR74A]KHE82454.1 hypothetical protein GE21DRAFT_210 [Neurospora crassa]|eukprot:XP_011393332.1 hypothetical protein NCU16318 [Neurospora crassa OR74A]